MKLTDIPAKQAVPFGVNGQREALLPTTPAGDNKASYNNGFPPVTMILKSAGGVPPKGQDMNQILFELSSLCRWFSAGGAIPFDQSFCTAISGYPKGARILGNDGATLYISTIDSNTNNPNVSTNGWLTIDLQSILDKVENAWSTKIVGSLSNGGTFSSCIVPGTYSVAINDTSTVSDFPKVNGVSIYGYGLMNVMKNGNTIEQLYISHKGHIATRQTWQGVGQYEPWVTQYSSVNKPTISDLGLGNSATKNIGTSSGTVAAGDDARFSYPIGINQTWHNVVSNRAIGVIYTNSYPKSIAVFAEVRPPAASTAVIEVDGVFVATAASGSTPNPSGVYAIIPPGGTYVIKASIGSAPSCTVWSELY